MEKYSRNLVEMCFFFFSVQVRYWCYLLPFIVTYLLSETASLYSLSFKAVCCCVIRHVFERPGKDKKKKKPKRIIVQDVWDRVGCFDRLFKL